MMSYLGEPAIRRSHSGLEKATAFPWLSASLTSLQTRPGRFQQRSRRPPARRGRNVLANRLRTGNSKIADKTKTELVEFICSISFAYYL